MQKDKIGATLCLSLWPHKMAVPSSSSSLCTMLSVQWEPEIIAVAVMYLAGRLSKFDLQGWVSKQSSRRWWEQFVQDVPVELLEGIGSRDAPPANSLAPG